MRLRHHSEAGRAFSRLCCGGLLLQLAAAAALSSSRLSPYTSVLLSLVVCVATRPPLFHSSRMCLAFSVTIVRSRVLAADGNYV